MSFTIEEMNYENPEVIKRVAEVFKAAFSNPPWNSARSQEEWDTAMQSLAKLRDTFSGKVWVAKINGKIVGAAVGHLRNSKEHPAEFNKNLGSQRCYHMRFTAVHPDHRRKGIAAAFDRVRLAHAAALKCDKVYGETVVQHGDRIRQLGRLGFTEFYRYVKSERTFVCLAKSVTT